MISKEIGNIHIGTCEECSHVYLFKATKCMMCPWEELRCEHLDGGEGFSVKADWFCADFRKRDGDMEIIVN